MDLIEDERTIHQPRVPRSQTLAKIMLSDRMFSDLHGCPGVQIPPRRYPLLEFAFEILANFESMLALIQEEQLLT